MEPRHSFFWQWYFETLPSIEKMTDSFNSSIRLFRPKASKQERKSWRKTMISPNHRSKTRRRPTTTKEKTERQADRAESTTTHPSMTQKEQNDKWISCSNFVRKSKEEPNDKRKVSCHRSKAGKRSQQSHDHKQNSNDHTRNDTRRGNKKEGAGRDRRSVQVSGIPVTVTWKTRRCDDWPHAKYYMAAAWRTDDEHCTIGTVRFGA